jgi:hypothetical protein
MGEEKDERLQLKSFRRDLRWERCADVLPRTKKLIQEGQANGYAWFEVSIEDPDTGDLLFFRSFEK